MTAISATPSSVTWWPSAASLMSGGSMATLVRRCSASAVTVAAVVPSAAVPVYSVWLLENSPISTPLSDSEARRASIAVGHVVRVDLGVALVGHVHDVAVRPEAARAVVAGLRQLLELLVNDALEALRFGVLDRDGFRPGRQAVGKEPFRAVVGDPDGDAVGPDAVRVAVGGGELVLGEQLAAPEVVGEEAVLPAIEHPHRLPAGPDAARIAVAVGECDVALGEALAALEVVGEQLLLAAVGDPDG